MLCSVILICTIEEEECSHQRYHNARRELLQVRLCAASAGDLTGSLTVVGAAAAASHAVLLVGSSVLLCRVLRDVPSSRGRALCRFDMAAVRSMSMRA